MTHRHRNAPDPDGSTVQNPQVTPRCGRKIHPYETVWGPLLDDVVCGRPAGHTGQHRSVQSINRERERGRERWKRYGRERRARILRERLAAAVAEAAEEARLRALGR